MDKQLTPVQNRLLKGKEKEFILAGNAIFTLESGITGRRFTYKVAKLGNSSLISTNQVYKVSLLTGQDNTKDYTFLGLITKDSVSLGRTSYDMHPVAIKAFEYFLHYIDNVPDALHVYHQGRCCRCGRLLTTPTSITSGIGYKCSKKA